MDWRKHLPRTWLLGVLTFVLAVSGSGAVLHTVNPRLSPADIAHILEQADDQVLLVDDVLLPVWERVRPLVRERQVVIMSDQPQGVPGTHDYETLLAAAPTRFAFPALPVELMSCPCEGKVCESVLSKPTG